MKKETNDATAEDSSIETKSAIKDSTKETETSIKSKGKKKKLRTISNVTDPTENDDTDLTKYHKTPETKDDIDDQEVPVKSKKKRARKIKEPVNQKTFDASKPPLSDDDSQIIEELETYLDPQPKKKKTKKSKKSKASTITTSGSFEDLQVANLDDINPTNPEININPNGTVPDESFETLSPSDNDTSEYEKAILDSFNNLASNISFSEFVGDDQWCIIHLPKPARAKSKPPIKKFLDNANKELKKPKQKVGLLKRMRTGVYRLVRKDKKLINGKSSTKGADHKEESDDVDADNLHRYAHRLRKIEDDDREINPEFLVLRDGKTVYGVHESDGDGKMKLSKRKPIYDRAADQKPNGQAEKKKLLSRLKAPFTRKKDKTDRTINSTNTAPNLGNRSRSNRKSLDNNLSTIADSDPQVI